MPDIVERAALREWETAARLAEFISQSMFKVSERTISETWPLTSIIVNKRKMLRTEGALTHADQMFAKATACAVRSGKLARAA